MGELYGGKRRRIASAYPVREPGRHRGRILRFLYLRHRRGAGVRAVVLSLRIGLGAIDARLCELRAGVRGAAGGGRSEEHTSELQSLMRISYAVLCLKKKKT